MVEIVRPQRTLALAEILDRVLNKGVFVIGDATISIAGVDLVYIGLKLFLSSVGTAERSRLTQQAAAESAACPRIDR